jgi:hypothetical protein
MPVLVQIPENPNCQAIDGQIFQCQSMPRAVTHVRWHRGDAYEWCDVTGLEDAGQPCPAMACMVEDSGEGACYLVTGGAWGLRLKPPTDRGPWSMDGAGQWGEPFLLLGGDGADLRFLD